MEKEAIHHGAGAQGHRGREKTVQHAGTNELAVGARVCGTEDGGKAQQRADEVYRPPSVGICQRDPDKRTNAVENDNDGGLVGSLDDGDVKVTGELAVGRVDDGSVDSAESGEEADLKKDCNLLDVNKKGVSIGLARSVDTHLEREIPVQRVFRVVRGPREKRFPIMINGLVVPLDGFVLVELRLLAGHNARRQRYHAHLLQ